MQATICKCDKNAKTILNSLLSKTICQCEKLQDYPYQTYFNARKLDEGNESGQSNFSMNSMISMEWDFLKSYHKTFKTLVYDYANNVNEKLGKEEISLQIDPVPATRKIFSYDLLFDLIKSTKLLTDKEKMLMCGYAEKTDTHEHVIFDMLTCIPGKLKKDIIFLMWLIFEEYFLLANNLYIHAREMELLMHKAQILEEKLLEKKEKIFQHLEGFQGKGKMENYEQKISNFSIFLKDLINFQLKYVASFYIE